MTNKEARLKNVADYTMITVGTFILAVSTSVFFAPFGLVVGGVTGLGIVIQGLVGDRVDIPLWLINLGFNVPLFIIAAKVKGLKFIGKTLFATVMLSVCLYITDFFPPMTDEFVLNAVFGGLTTGLGVGLVFRGSATTGGSDLAAWVVHHFFRHVSLAKILFAIDAAVILAGFLVFGPEKTMYAISAAYIASKATSAALEGLSFSKAAYIISDKSTQIGELLMSELERGVTMLSGWGMYTGDKKDIILCVVSSKEIVRLKDIARSVDKDAFLFVADVREVLGEGFTTA